MTTATYNSTEPTAFKAIRLKSHSPMPYRLNNNDYYIAINQNDVIYITTTSKGVRVGHISALYFFPWDQIAWCQE